MLESNNRPFELAIQVQQNRRAGEQKLHWDKTKKSYIILNGNFLCLSCPSATFALQHGNFVPPEWLAAKGLFYNEGGGQLRYRKAKIFKKQANA